MGEGGGLMVNTSLTDNRNAKTQFISSLWASYYLNRGIHPNRPIIVSFETCVFLSTTIMFPVIKA